MCIASALRRLLLLIPIATVPGCLQLGSGELEIDPPKIEVTLRLDQDKYGIGEPIVATVEVQNLGDVVAVLPVPGRAVCEIYCQPEGAAVDALEQAEFLSSPDEQTGYSDVDGGESISRPLLVYRFTNEHRKPGRYAFFARYRTEEQAISQAGEDTSDRVIVTVLPERKFDRDREGRLTDAEAIRLARKHFKADDAAAAEALLAKDEARLDVWLVTVHCTGDDGKTTARSTLVSPYTGKVKRDANTTVAAEKAKPK